MLENLEGVKMKRCAWVGMGFWLLSPLICSAEWYKYQDKNGVWHYSDSLTTEVPFEQRKKTKKYTESDDYLSAAEREKKRTREALEKEEKDRAVVEKEKEERIRGQYKSIDNYEALEQKRTELADVYKNMMEKKSKLDAQKTKVDTAKAYKEHQATVAEYNKSAEEYKVRRKAYEEAVKAFEQKQKK